MSSAALVGGLHPQVPSIHPSYSKNPVVRALSSLNSRMYSCWISAITRFVNTCRSHGFLKLGLGLGMLLTEPHILCKALWYTKRTYAKDPLKYGFNTVSDEQKDHRPVLLFHGAVGSWNYLGDLAKSLKEAAIPVFVINLGMQLSPEERQRQVVAKIDEIQNIYIQKFGKAPKVDLVAHSMGAFTALDTARSEVHPRIGKVITLAMPSSAEEVAQVSALYNINAQFDALMGYKQCALVGERSKQVYEVPSGHVGIVFKEHTFTHILEILKN